MTVVRPFAIALAIAFLFFAWTDVLQADPGKPVIKKIDPNKAPGGAIVHIEGANFTKEVDMIEVAFGKDLAIVLSATPEKITVLVPMGLKKGKYKEK